MRTIKMVDGWRAQHNGDFSGNVSIVNDNGGPEMLIPFEVLKCIVAEQQRRERRRRLDAASDDEILAGAF